MPPARAAPHLLQGRGWESGAVRAKLQELCDKYADVPKQPPYLYDGPQIGKGHCRAQGPRIAGLASPGGACGSCPNMGPGVMWCSR